MENSHSWPVPIPHFNAAPGHIPSLHEFDLYANPPKFEEFFVRATQRGLNDVEFSAILNYINNSDLSVQDKKRLLDYAVPSSVAPEDTLKNFLSWFFGNYPKAIGKSLAVHILKWVIDLLDNALVTSDVVNIFYFDLYVVLHYRDLLKYVCILLCKLTKPKDVTPMVVKTVTEKYRECVDSNDDKFLLSVLQVFKGFKPHLVPDSLKSVDINKTFSSLLGDGNYTMKLVNRREQVPSRSTIGVFELRAENLREKSSNVLSTINPLSRLIPCPTFKTEDKISSTGISFPDNIEEAFALINIPSVDNMISLLRDEAGFFMIWNGGVDAFERFSVILFQKLQSVFIFQEVEASEEDKDRLLSRVYKFQSFAHQGIPSVSQFLDGYLLHWDGIDHRLHILNLIEWVVFNDFKWLSANILRPLYMLFVTSNATMKQQIIQCLTNLLKNVFSAIEEQEITHPLEKRPAWINDAVHVLSSLIEWVEELIKIGLCLEDGNSNFLLQSVHFYEIINELETSCKLPLWTVISKGVLTRSLFKPAPVILNRVCRLILKYYETFLPNLRASQPDFYHECNEKMATTLRYAHQLINLWTGQEMLPEGSEDGGIIPKQLVVENFDFSRSRDVSTDNLFDLSHNAVWLPYVLHERNQNGADFLIGNKDYLINFEYYLEDISAFIKYFSPRNPSP